MRYVLPFVLGLLLMAALVSFAKAEECDFTRTDAIIEVLGDHYVPVSIAGDTLARLLKNSGAHDDVDEFIAVKIEEPGEEATDLLIAIKDGCVTGQGEVKDSDLQAWLTGVRS